MSDFPFADLTLKVLITTAADHIFSVKIRLSISCEFTWNAKKNTDKNIMLFAKYDSA